MIEGLVSLVQVSFVLVSLLFRLWRRGGNGAVDASVVAFFHPYCNDGGGGERVLWCIVRTMQTMYRSKLKYRVYHGDFAETGENILAKAKERFGIQLREPVEFVLLTKRQWVEASQYPVLTLLGQAIGSMVLAADALLQSARAPKYVFDTMGYAFSYPILARFGGCEVLSYTHYPMISTDMLNRVIERRPTYNNQATVTGSATLSRAKGLYYKLFARLYGAVGRWCDVIIVNSKWTAAHIDALWGCKSRVVYPAVDTRTLEAIPLGPGREPLCISVAQFRPEKDHELQIRAFAMFCLEWRSSRLQEACPKLVMIGSVRNSGDAAIVARLMELKGELRLSDDEFEIAMNVSYAELQKYLAHARVGWSE